jgi:hypothetical protein
MNIGGDNGFQIKYLITNGRLLDAPSQRSRNLDNRPAQHFTLKR